MPAALLAAFVLGVGVLQWQAELPDIAVLLPGLLAGGLAVDGAVTVSAARAIAVRYWHDRPAEGQEPGPSGEELDLEDPECEPLSGMP